MRRENPVRIVKARVIFALVAGVFLAGTTLLSVESPAQQAQRNDAPGSSWADGSLVHDPGNTREAEAFFDKLVLEQLREEHVAGATMTLVEDGRLVFD